MIEVMKRKLEPSGFAKIAPNAATIAGTVLGALAGGAPGAAAGASIGSGVGTLAKGASEKDMGVALEGVAKGAAGAAGASGAVGASGGTDAVDASPLFGQSDDTLSALKRRLLLGVRGRGEL